MEILRFGNSKDTYPISAQGEFSHETRGLEGIYALQRSVCLPAPMLF
jgi:hypothetical protein